MNSNRSKSVTASNSGKFRDPLIAREIEDFALQAGRRYPCATDAEEGALFEQFAVLNILRRWHMPELSFRDLPFFMVGTDNDLQLDSIAILVNEELVENEQHLHDLLEDSGRVAIQFIFQQATRSPTFDMKKMREFVDGVEHFFAREGFLRENDLIKAKRALKDSLFRMIEGKKDVHLEVYLYYCSLGKWTDTIERDGWRLWAEDKILLRRPGIEVEVETVDFLRLRECLEKNQPADFVHANEEYSREILVDNLLPFADIPGANAFLGFVKASEYLKLLGREDDQGIFERIFAGNVRGFEGMSNPVNAKIGQTLRSPASSEFVLLNNGVTVIAPSVFYDQGKLRMVNYQVVNGLQTSYVLYKNRRRISGDDSIYLPIKIVETQNQALADSIILGTNQQTVIGKVDYVSRLPMVRRLENLFEARAREGGEPLWLERRRGQYRRASFIDNLNRIISLEDVLRGFTAVFLKQPHDAEKGLSQVLPDIPEKVLNDAHLPELYYAAAHIRFLVREFLEKPASKDLESYEYHLDHLCRFLCEPAAGPDAPFDEPVWKAYCQGLEQTLSRPERVTWALEQAGQILRKIRSGHPRSSVRRREAPQRAETTRQSLAAAANILGLRPWRAE